MARFPTIAMYYLTVILIILTSLSSALIPHDTQVQLSRRSTLGAPSHIIGSTKLSPSNIFTPTSAVISADMRNELINSTTSSIIPAVATPTMDLNSNPTTSSNATPSDAPLTDALANDPAPKDKDLVASFGNWFRPGYYILLCYCTLSIFLLCLMWSCAWIDNKFCPTDKFLWGYYPYGRIINYSNSNGNSNSTADLESGIWRRSHRSSMRHPGAMASEDRYLRIETDLRRLGI